MALTAADMMGVRWQAAEETTIGGWCVQPEGSPPTHEGGLEVANFMTQEMAEHVARLHNAELGFEDTLVEAARKAEAHLEDCWAFLNGDTAEPETAAPYDGCVTCEVREVLHVIRPILRAGAGVA